MLHLIGIGIRTGTSLRRKIVDSIALAAIGLMAIIGILALASCGGNERLWDTMTTPEHWAGERTLATEEKIQLTAVCSSMPAKVVTCTWIPFEEKHRTEAEQKLYEERN